MGKNAYFGARNVFFPLKETRQIYITVASQLMLLVLMLVDSGNRVVPVNTLRGLIAEFDDNAGGTYSYHWSL